MRFLMKKQVLIYVLALSMPLAMGLVALQSAHYTGLARQVAALNREQEDVIEVNKRLIMDIAALSSPERIEKIAKEELGLKQAPPEAVMQVRIR
jgi:cell division protein FtsL